MNQGKTHLPRAIISPLKELLTHMNVITHSNAPQRYKGIFLDGEDRMIRSAHIIGTHSRLIQVWSLIILRTPLPLLLLATWRCHNILIMRGKPRIMLDMQIAERPVWWSLRKFFIACSHSDEQLSDELALPTMLILIQFFWPIFLIVAFRWT